MNSLKRKGARRIADIPPKILEQINQGKIETVNLIECLAIDFAKLLQACFPTIKNISLKKMQDACGLGWLERTKLAASILYEEYSIEVLPKLLHHTSDNIRGWAAGVVARIPDASLTERLALIQPIIDDPNSGTRELAWLLIREHISKNIYETIEHLTAWAKHPSPNFRRFVIESTRPRGVWCSHIPLLKENPTLGLPLLEPLLSDVSRYVQNSVANWLNDAAKSQPDWVLSLTKDWLKKSKTKETQYICKRALRSINP